MFRKLALGACALFCLSLPAHAQAIFRLQNVSSGGAPSANPGWIIGQDIFLNSGCATGTTCNTSDAYYPLPLTANSIRIVSAVCGNGSSTTRTISSATINGSALTTNASWVASTGSGDQVAMAYGVGVGGTGSNLPINVTMSGSCPNLYTILTELIPPAGFTGALDQFVGTASASCTSCTGAAFSGLAGPDAIVQIVEQVVNGPVTWNSCSGNYILTPNSDCFYQNSPSGSVSAPTVTMSAAGPTAIGAMAFKTTSTFSVPTPVFSLVNYGNISSTGANQGCSPTCTFTVPSTGTGNLLFLAIADPSGVNLSSVTGGGTWVVPASCQQLLTQSATNYQLSCGYVLSSTSAATTLNITMASNASIGIGYFEVHRTTGSFALDVTAKGTDAASFTPQNGNLTLTGGTAANDVIFHALYAPGGTGGNTVDPQPGSQNIGAQFLNANASCSVLLNTNIGTGNFWVYQNDATTGYFSMSFN
jgi:hypothetical protein